MRWTRIGMANFRVASSANFPVSPEVRIALSISTRTTIGPSLARSGWRVLQMSKGFPSALTPLHGKRPRQERPRDLLRDRVGTVLRFL